MTLRPVDTGEIPAIPIAELTGLTGKVLQVWKKEPIRLVYWAVILGGGALAHFGWDIDLERILTGAFVILGGGETARSQAWAPASVEELQAEYRASVEMWQKLADVDDHH